jgi:hypothetical protein
MLHRAVGAQVDDPELVKHLPRLLFLLTAPLATLYWKDYLGLTARDAAQTAAWSIHIPAGRHATTLAYAHSAGRCE